MEQSGESVAGKKKKGSRKIGHPKKEMNPGSLSYAIKRKAKQGTQ